MFAGGISATQTAPKHGRAPRRSSGSAGSAAGSTASAGRRRAPSAPGSGSQGDAPPAGSPGDGKADTRVRDDGEHGAGPPRRYNSAGVWNFRDDGETTRRDSRQSARSAGRPPPAARRRVTLPPDPRWEQRCNSDSARQYDSSGPLPVSFFTAVGQADAKGADGAAGTPAALCSALRQAVGDAQQARDTLDAKERALLELRRQLSEERRQRERESERAAELREARAQLESDREALSTRVSLLEAQLAAAQALVAAKEQSGGNTTARPAVQGSSAVSCRRCRLTFPTVEDWELHTETVYHRLRHAELSDTDDDHTVVPVPAAGNRPTWCPDREARVCYCCRRDFSAVRRRHHCRHCGEVFCGRCSRRALPIPRLGYSSPQRVCDPCFAVLQGQSLEWFPASVTDCGAP
eukprot:TRINITY_DN26400_c1_g1_i4.p1 TRINITY_DN26400_c1_g1~~TRINITY_DN26400_c1_g1_i4.p1  ORF type:complete len:407 (+),score=108.51 TRINITY_DN26400_c1_g1_i4:78-1298(+)